MLPYVLDGGLATEIERRGVRAQGGLWSTAALIESPAEVEAVHRDYLLAGADIVSTATYQAAHALLVREGLDPAATLARGVMVARNARDAARPGARVAASMGPYGAHLGDGSEYRGDYLVGEVELTDFHARQAELLWAAGPDLLAFETVPSWVEAQCILRALERLGSPPAWISLSVAPDGARVAAGDASIGEAWRALAGAGVMPGANCAPPEVLEAALEAAGGPIAVPVVIYPNSGESWSAEARSWSGAPDDLAARAERYVALGAGIVGGCCRTTPADIAAIAARIRR